MIAAKSLQRSRVVETENTRSNASLTDPEPDVFLNTFVSVEEMNKSRVVENDSTQGHPGTRNCC